MCDRIAAATVNTGSTLAGSGSRSSMAATAQPSALVTGAAIAARRGSNSPLHSAILLGTPVPARQPAAATEAARLRSP